MKEPIGIIGLGRIGMPAAKAYLGSGYEIFGYDIRPEALEELAAVGGVPLQSPAEVARRAAVILVMVLNDDQVTAVIAGEKGILKGINPGGTVICMSTINQAALQSVAWQCKERNIGFADCPFTGGPARIGSRTLTLIAAAPHDLLAKVRPVLEVIGRIVHAGSDPGLGQAIKHCNQLLVGATHAATMEVITLARKLGLDPELVTAVIASGIAGSDYFRLLSESVVKKTPSPGSLGQMCKDMAIVKNTMENVQMNGYVASAVSEYFSAAARLGMQNREGAALIEVVERLSAGKENLPDKEK